MTSSTGNGLLAGLAATVVLSALMVIKTAMGVMPELDVPKMIAGMMGRPELPLLGWATHFMIGVVCYGIAVAILNERLPGRSPTAQGVLIGIGRWLLMMVMVMPMAGVGLFGMAMGVMAQMMTLALRLIFGAVLGWTYGKLTSCLPAGALADAWWFMGPGPHRFRTTRPSAYCSPRWRGLPLNLNWRADAPSSSR